MGAFLVATAHPACGTPGRLRHSWLDNQVLLVLRPGRGVTMSAGHFMELLVPWEDDLEDLTTYALNFPSVVDPSVFLQEFSTLRNVQLSASLLGALSTAFKDSFVAQRGQTIEQYRLLLLQAAQQLQVKYSILKKEISQAPPAKDVPVSTLASARVTYEAGILVHELLGQAPRGVWLS